MRSTAELASVLKGSTFMPRVFIVRPFDVKEGINFDEVDRQLIQPAMKAAGVQGATTTEIAKAGNIREDMFRLLVTSDLVIADLSIHNANVFYELGIRHGLRPRGTLLIRADVHAYPFDLQTDRFLLYKTAQPGASVEALAKAIKETLAATGTDSPVYMMLPSLTAPSATALRVVPQDFREAVVYAAAKKERGDLRLLAHEAEWFEWASEGLRAVGREQFKLGAFPGAKETFEALLRLLPKDIEANQRLGTIYQKLGDLDRSSQVIQRVIESPDAATSDRAEAFALQGSNAKKRWMSSFGALAGQELQVAALRAPALKESIERYTAGFEQDLNHFYSGLNALSLLQLRNSLAAVAPTIWSEWFETDDEATRSLKESQARFEQFAHAVEMSIAARVTFLNAQQPRDTDSLMWATISRADLGFLIGQRATAVANRYREAVANAPDFARSTARAQVELFRKLGVRTDFADAAIAAIDEPASPAAAPSSPAAPKAAPPDRVLLFTGHMVDSSERKTARFPRTSAAEAEARRLIRESVERERKLEAGRILGVAGGACGGDILFHEVCLELGIETRLLLALPKEKFSATSVQHGGGDWVERYNRLCARVSPRVLSEQEELPAWLQTKADYNIWPRNNLWMLFNSLAIDARSLTLIALWDGGPADGPGGTKDLVQLVKNHGDKVDVLPAQTLKQFTQ
jgi:tetratricopeptide (TPR) repeat protein